MFDFKALTAHFPIDVIEWRVGPSMKDNSKGIALAYIDARHVMDRLDEVCGPENWQNRYSHADTKTVCELLINTGVEWIGKSDGSGDTDIEGVKGALSDAFKRSGVRWGIGRYLYNVPTVWVKLKAQGRSFVIDPSEEKGLQKILEGMAEGKTPSKPKKEMVGPIKPMTALVSKFKSLCSVVREQVEIDSLVALKEQKSYISLVKQLKVDAPDLWNMEDDGNGGMGLMQLIIKKEDELAP